MREARERAERERKERERLEQERRDREALARAHAEFTRLEEEVQALRESGIEIEDLKPLDDSVEGMSVASAAEQIQAHVRTERQRLIGGASRLSIEITIDAPTETLEQAVKTALDQHQGEATEKSHEFELLVGATIDRLMARLDPEATVTPEIESAIRTAGNSENEPGRRRLGLDALRNAVADANRKAAEQQTKRDEIEEMILSLAGLENEEAAEVEHTLKEAGDEIDLAPIRTRVERILEEERTKWEAGYVVDSLTDVLDDLGYEVEEGFLSTIDSNGFADLGHNRWPGYAIRVRRTSGGISLNVVRGEADRVDQAARDADVEQMWCSDVRQLEEKLLELGVDLSRIRALDPGELEMQVVPEIQVPAERHRQHDRESEGDIG
jgi:hypothetical protein